MVIQMGTGRGDEKVNLGGGKSPSTQMEML